MARTSLSRKCCCNKLNTNPNASLFCHKFYFGSLMKPDASKKRKQLQSFASDFDKMPHISSDMFDSEFDSMMKEHKKMELHHEKLFKSMDNEMDQAFKNFDFDSNLFQQKKRKSKKRNISPKQSSLTKYNGMTQHLKKNVNKMNNIIIEQFNKPKSIVKYGIEKLKNNITQLKCDLKEKNDKLYAKFQRKENYDKNNIIINEFEKNDDFILKNNNDNDNNNDTSIFNLYIKQGRKNKSIEVPNYAFEIWHNNTYTEDVIYGKDPDCECPYLYLLRPKHCNEYNMANHNMANNKNNNNNFLSKFWDSEGKMEYKYYSNLWYFYNIWGYFKERELRHRCAMFSYMKAQRRCNNKLFWKTFELFDCDNIIKFEKINRLKIFDSDSLDEFELISNENDFRTELQILCIHLWIIKTRMQMFNSPMCHQMSYEMFRIMFNELIYRFPHFHATSPHWESECQQACLHLAFAMDNAFENFNYQTYDNNDNNKKIIFDTFNDVIWNEIYFNENIDKDILYCWSQYICNEINHLSHINDLDFVNGWWQFGAVPTMKDRIEMQQRLNNQENIENENNEIEYETINAIDDTSKKTFLLGDGSFDHVSSQTRRQHAYDYNYV